MGADTQVIDGILKDYYEDFVSEQLNQRNPLSDLFKFEDVPFAGREIVYSTHVARNVSPMFVGEDRVCGCRRPGSRSGARRPEEADGAYPHDC
jgi:hypothetical protein